MPGTIADAGKWLREHGPPRTPFDVSTLKEPYRVEGKKTMAYELYEQLDGEMPDVIVYPTGGGTGLVGMWKAFGEMRALGWPMRAHRSRASCQRAGRGLRSRWCARFVGGADTDGAVCRIRNHARVRTARAVADRRLSLPARDPRDARHRRRRRPNATIAPAAPWLAAASGVDVCPEGGAAWAAVEELRVSRLDRPDDARGRVQHRHRPEVPIVSRAPPTDARRRSGGRSGP